MLLLASSLPVIIDVVTVLIIVGCVIFAGIRGVVRSFVSDFGAIISMILSMALCALMANFLESQFGLISALSKSISGALDGIFGKELMNTTLGEANSSGMTGILSSWLIQIVSGVKEQGKIPLDTTLNKVIAPVFGYYVACFISVIVLYALFRILFFLVGRMFIKVRKIKLVKKVDTLLGLALGLIKGLFIVGFVILIINFLPIGFVQDISREMSNAPITNFLSNINLLSVIINGIANPASLSTVIANVIK